ncbi:MAG: ribonuclease Y [Planctomycetota bacterium]|jgi:ribonuclease Y
MDTLYILAADTRWGWPHAMLFLLAGVAIGGVMMMVIARTRRSATVKELDSLKGAAEAEARKIVNEAKAEAEGEFLSRREKFEDETRGVRNELRAEEKRIAKREDLIDQKLETLHARERMAESAHQALAERENGLVAKDRQLNDLIAQQRTQLLKVASLSESQARDMLMSRLQKDMEQETSKYVEQQLSNAREMAEREAREVVVRAIQRYAADQTSESTVASVDIPSDDVKGRVIGREGRNIRAFEKATGVDVIVDDTPGVVVVSSFDPVRREIARRALAKLIQDGRIHPTRIEELAAATEKELRKEIAETGRSAVMEAKLRGVNNRLVELLGRLKFRTSYGQNVLQHSMEVAFLSQMMAEEFGLNGALARRAGLLHDIGKAVDHEVDGSHPQIGSELLKRYKERPEVIEAAGAHHGDIEATSIYTPIVASADAISAARPGARRDSVERYIQRLQKLEEIASTFEGVEQAYAIQAGREVRVIVDAANVDDRLSSKVARDIARRIEDEMEYPGEIRVTLIRETRCTEYAR